MALWMNEEHKCETVWFLFRTAVKKWTRGLYSYVLPVFIKENRGRSTLLRATLIEWASKHYPVGGYLFSNWISMENIFDLVLSLPLFEERYPSYPAGPAVTLPHAHPHYSTPAVLPYCVDDILSHVQATTLIDIPAFSSAEPSRVTTLCISLPSVSNMYRSSPASLHQQSSPRCCDPVCVIMPYFPALLSAIFTASLGPGRVCKPSNNQLPAGSN
jgi:hypothetical protein